ncbi:hypothetical protein [Devosia alba]|uniref:hypothetical protein n=1 Tax=Devosia alba TaxID=3152360 RepID=UPI0032673822
MNFDFEQFWRGNREEAWPKSLILCLFTGPKLPNYSAQMPREPAPRIGDVFDHNFLNLYRNALWLNSSVHDGAVMIGRSVPSAPYAIMGWSYRLFPPKVHGLEIANRGSATNSCIAMSLVEGVDATYKITDGHLLRFVRGQMAEVG